MASRNTRNFEFKLGKQALVLFVLGMSLLLFSVFLFGVVVGKHIEAYPETIARGIPGMIRNALGFGKGKTAAELAAREETEAAAGDQQDDFDLTFYDTLAKKTPGGNDPARRGKPGAEGVKSPAVAADTAAEIAPGDASGDAAGGASGAGADGENKKTPGSVAADTGQAGSGASVRAYIIHVASFREKGSSEQLVKKLTAHGYAATMHVRDLPGKGKWFRVVVGEFRTRGEAQKALDAMAGQIKGVKATVIAIGEKN